MNDIITPNQIRGRVRAHEVKAAGSLFERLFRGLTWLPTTPWSRNLVVYEWGAIVSRLLATGDVAYRIGGMYLEFENVDTPGDPVSPPTRLRWVSSSARSKSPAR